MYYGFSVSLYNIASFIVSWLLSYILHPSLTQTITKKFPELIDKIAYYSEGSSKTAFADKILPVSTLTEDQITRIVADSGLPNPFSSNIQSNLVQQNLDGLNSVGQYIDYTVANTILNLISFIVIFLALQLFFMLIVSVVNNVIYLPVLKKFDNLTAGFLGMFRGVLFLFIVFALVPLLYLVIPADFLARFFDGSKFSGFFIDANFFTAFVKGII